MARERPQVIEARQKAVIAKYDKFKQTIKPADWWSLPAVSVILADEEIAALVNDPSANPLQEDQLRKPFENLPAFVAQLASQKTSVLVNLLPENERQAAAENGLRLATAIFECKTHNGCAGLIPYDKPNRLPANATARGLPYASRAIFGLHAALTHRCPGSERAGLVLWSGRLHQASLTIEPQFTLSERGRSAVVHLLGLLALDPAIATRTDLSVKNARFTCKQCPNNEFAEISLKPVMTWEHCVSPLPQFDERFFSVDWVSGGTLHRV
jgi:hypothetical protein